jgi:hypothetical protein
MTHDEVRSLLETADNPGIGCGAVDALIDEHIDHVNTRIDELLQLRAQLTTLRERCGGARPVEDCGIIHRNQKRPTWARHQAGTTPPLNAFERPTATTNCHADNCTGDRLMDSTSR